MNFYKTSSIFWPALGGMFGGGVVNFLVDSKLSKMRGNLPEAQRRAAVYGGLGLGPGAIYANVFHNPDEFPSSNMAARLKQKIMGR